MFLESYKYNEKQITLFQHLSVGVYSFNIGCTVIAGTFLPVIRNNLPIKTLLN